MAMNSENKSRSPEVQRAQAEEMRQRLEEQYYQLEVQKYNLEFDKLVTDVLKHFATVVTALLLILAYFGSPIRLGWRNAGSIWGISLWDIGILCLALSFVTSITLMIVIAAYPGDSRKDYFRKWLVAILFLMSVALAIIVLGLVYI
jgi:hypothetical protein